MQGVLRLSISCIAGAAAMWAAHASMAADVTVQGFVRFETAPKLTADENPFNQKGNPFNGRVVTLDSSSLGGGGVTTTARQGGRADNEFNLFAGRMELDTQVFFNDSLTGFMRLRAHSQPDVYDELGEPDLYGAPFWHGENSGTLLEFAEDNVMIDVPALYLDFTKGPFWMRVGNQQIAWGESLFFRVLDVPNGLDLRRHLILDLVSEEYADERVPSPAVRTSYRLGEAIEIEGFAQMFNPSILANPNTPYNLIPSQFTVHQDETFEAVRGDFNFGTRVQGQFDSLGIQAIAVSRRNPDGVFRWARSGVNRDLPGVAGSGAVLQNTPFEVDPTGVNSSQEWFNYAGMTRLNGATALDAAVNDFPAAFALGAFDTNGNFFLAQQELDLFFQLSGGLRGHIERVFPREEIFGVGGSYIVDAEPGTLLDQLVIRGEATYTPNKIFTAPDLGTDFVVADEWVGMLALEKYHRFSREFPATYFLLQYLFKSESDLFGRHLSGNGGGASNVPSTGDEHGFHAFAFAFQQPFPNLVWRADMSVLYDVNGGMLIQPAVRWKPSEAWQLDLFANIAFSDGGNDDIISTIDWSDEFGVRLTWQF